MNDVRTLFVDERETAVAVIGNSYLQTFLATGQKGKGFAVLSDRRVYFKGKCLYKNNKKYRSSNEERIVDLTDVTGSGFENIVEYSSLILSIIFLLISFIGFASSEAAVRTVLGGFNFILFGIFLAYFFINKRNIFKIDYPGGTIAFDLRFVSKSEAETFNRALRTAKDNVKSQASQSVAFVNTSANNSVAYELRQLNDLLSQGIISKEDFEAKKKQLLSL